MDGLFKDILDAILKHLKEGRTHQEEAERLLEGLMRGDDLRAKVEGEGKEDG